jgi:Domain of unknown function (DUF4136)
MNTTRNLITSLIAIAMLTATAWAGMSVDYKHSINFGNYRTYSWAKVQTTDPFLDARVKGAINRELAAKGWTEVPSGGNVALVAVQMTRTRREVNTSYDGFGGGFGDGFYGGFGGGFGDGFGESTTTVQHYEVGTLVVSMFDAHSKNLIWRGVSTDALSHNPKKNTKNLDKEVAKMFQHFPPKAAA